MHSAYQHEFVHNHGSVTDIPQECQRSLTAMYAWPEHEHHPRILVSLDHPPLLGYLAWSYLDLGHLAMIHMASLQGCNRKTQVA